MGVFRSPEGVTKNGRLEKRGRGERRGREGENTRRSQCVCPCSYIQLEVSFSWTYAQKYPSKIEDLNLFSEWDCYK